MEVRKQLHILNRFPVNMDTIYEFELRLVLDKVENPGWFRTISKGPRKGERDAKTRYKKIDVDNRVKFLQDCVSRAIGIPDDAQIFKGGHEKVQGSPQRAEVTVRVLEDPKRFLGEQDGRR